MLKRASVAGAALAILALLASCAGTAPDASPGDGPAAENKEQDLASWGGIAEALGCTYMSGPVQDSELGQERSICEYKDDSAKFVTVVKAEDPQAAEAAFTTFEQPYTFVSEMWALVGEVAILEEAAKKLGSEVHGQPGEGEASAPVEGEPGEESGAPFSGTAVFGDKLTYPDGVEVEVIKMVGGEVNQYETEIDDGAKIGDTYVVMTIRVRNGSEVPLDTYSSSTVTYGPDGEEAPSQFVENMKENELSGKILPGKAKLQTSAFRIPTKYQADVVLEFSFDMEHEVAIFTGSVKK